MQLIRQGEDPYRWQVRELDPLTMQAVPYCAYLYDHQDRAFLMAQQLCDEGRMCEVVQILAYTVMDKEV